MEFKKLPGTARVLYFAVLIASPVCFGFGVYFFIIKKYFAILGVLIYLLLTPFVLYFIKSKPEKLYLLKYVISFMASIGPIQIMFTEIEKTEQLIWLVTYPVYVFISAGFKAGIIWNLCLYILFFVAYFIHPFYIQQPHIAPSVILHFSLSNLFVLTISGYFAYKVGKDHEKLSIFAIHDPLTNVFNRRHVSNILSGILNKQTEKNNGLFSIILLDIDDFKIINDTHGHSIGDKILIEFCNQIQRAIRKSDLLARWGGEEFLIVLENTQLQQAVKIAAKIRESINTHQYANQIKVKASFGVAQHVGELRYEDVIHRADTALYFSKSHGKDLISSCDYDNIVESCSTCGNNVKKGYCKLEPIITL
ncbi:MAG: GGDEF domain-containing protein [Spirochaetia bacterium]|nr:GGDEF domain-containing protein [Spirochaetia bacterium]